jgi:hypothetical protein
MHVLSDFIFRQISKQAEVSVKRGREKYAAYFVNIDLYQSRRAEVDAALTKAGLVKVITQG